MKTSFIRVVRYLAFIFVLLFSIGNFRRVNQPLDENPAKDYDDPASSHDIQSKRRKRRLVVRKTDGIVRKSHDTAPFILEEYKLIFFTIPKNACTVFKQLFRRMMGYDDWYVYNKTLPHDLAHNGLKDLSIHRANLTVVQEMLTSPEYTKAVFVRDPVERFLSAFLDKAYQGRKEYRHWCCNRWQRQNLSFKQCYEAAQTPQGFFSGIQTCQDHHWSPQYQRLNKRYWDNIDWFVGHVETAYQDTRRLLEKLGAWEKFGQSGWGPHKNESIFQSNWSPHSMGARSQVERYITPALKERLFEYYHVDYDHELFDLERQ